MILTCLSGDVSVSGAEGIVVARVGDAAIMLREIDQQIEKSVNLASLDPVARAQRALYRAQAATFAPGFEALVGDGQTVAAVPDDLSTAGDVAAFQSADVILVVNDRKGLEQLVSNQFKVGADAAVTALARLAGGDLAHARLPTFRATCSPA